MESASSSYEAQTRIACWLALFGVSCAIVWFRSVDNRIAGAFYGWSPTTLIADFWNAPAFVSRNYPGGEEELLKSAAYLPLPFFGALGLPKVVAFPLLIALEVAAFAWGAIFAVRRLVRDATVPQAVVAAILLISGTLASGNLARWGQPYYGSVYNYAYGTGLAGSALLLTGGLKRGSALIAATYVIHPTLGLFFGLFAAAGILADFARLRWRNLLAGAVIFLAISGIWTLIVMRSASVSGAAIPADAFISFTRMMGYHLFPISYGLFGRFAYERFEPFLSVCLLIATYLFQDRRPLAPVERQVAAGLAILGVVTLIGIFAAELSGTPFVIKLALHRASLIILLIGALFVAPGLLRDLSSGSWWRAVPAAAILSSVFFDLYGPPLLISLLLSVIAVALDLRQGRAPPAFVLVAIVGVFFSGAWLAADGFPQAMPGVYSGFDTVSNPRFLALVATLLLLRAFRLATLAPVALGIAACFWAVSLMPLADGELRAKAAAYLEAQRWANANTAPDALFMVDPGLAYGWREYSERPSFGSVREWLYAGWVYNSRREVYDAGLDRLAFLGLTKDEVLIRASANPDYGRGQLARDVQSLYYGKDAGWFRTATQRYGIDYFVMDEAMARDVPGLEVVYRNDGYSIRRLATVKRP